jgi:formylglycine-generating enzyme required for sulfatase activity
MTKETDPRRRLAEVEAMLAGQEALRRLLPSEQAELVIAGLSAEKTMLLARLSVGGAVAQGDGAVAAGGDAAGRDLTKIEFHLGAATERSDAAAASLHTAYLHRLIAQTELLPLRGIDPAAADSQHDPSLKLSAVYTALQTRLPRDGEGRFKRDPRAEEQAPGSALEQLDRHRRLVLLGDPGSGKSTFVNFVALSLAGEALELPEANLTLLTAPLPKEDDDDPEEATPQPWSHGALLPVRVVLRDFAVRGLPAESAEPAAAGCLWKFVQQDLEEAGHADFFPTLRQELLAGRGLVLLDGLDEVPEADRRREQMLQAVQAFANAIGTSRVLLTSRTYAYQNPAWRLSGFPVAIMAPFSRRQIARFVRLWYEQRVTLGKMTKEEAQGRGELLLRVILTNDRLLALAERPLLLTLMASLHAWRGGNLPERREELYADAVELLLNTWDSQRVRLDGTGKPLLAEPSLAAWLKVDRQEVRRLLDELAYEAHRSQPDPAETADVEEGKLVGGLLDLNRNQGVDASQLVAYLCDRSGLLVERGPRVYTFPHRTFQEYLAACHLTGGGFPEELAELGRNEPGRWREVVLLAGAKAARGAVSSVWSLAETLCDLGRDVEREPGSPGTSREDEWGALLAGQVVAESADLTRVGRANEPKLERLKKWLLYLMRLEQFPALERVAAGKALAVLGDPRFGPDRWLLPMKPELGFVEVPEGTFVMGSDKKDDPGAWEDEFPRHEVALPRFWISRFPVTVGQFRVFAEESGTPVDPRSLEGPANLPVAYVDWQDATAYCKWLGARLREMASEQCLTREMPSAFWNGLARGSLRANLPSEEEWEKAARWTDGRLYPWGQVADPNRANFADTGVQERSPVGCFSGGASVYGCEEMSGNVWEWTRSVWRKSYAEKEASESAQSLRVVRGGAFSNSSGVVRCAYRLRNFPDDRVVSLGFRVVLSPFPL